MARRRSFAWANTSDEELLDKRLCDLGVQLEGTWLEEVIAKVVGELAARQIRLVPTFWLADEWLSPDGLPGVGIPFYLAHPRLMQLERHQMLEVEGGSRRECTRLLRHELGHAVQHGYQLQRRRRWQEIFGRASTPYPESYRPNPASRRFVQHLEGWYAQSHPVEDFAETFAVWLSPRASWRKRYRGWSALRKLEYVDELMGELRGAAPVVRSRAQPYAVSRIRSTLRRHYQFKREHYSVGYTDTYDADLQRLFPASPSKLKASRFLRAHRAEIRSIVARWTGDYMFAVDHLLKEMIGRCRELDLRTGGTEREKYEFAILLATRSMTYVFRRREWHAL